MERLISIVAPHRCIACGLEGAVVCLECLPDFALPVPSRCYRCNVLTQDNAVCKKCRRHVRLKHVWVYAEYEPYVKKLIHGLKFENKRAAAEPIAEMIVSRLPFLPRETIVTHVPTATSRVRKRGYDQAELIAKAMASKCGLPYSPLLIRVTQTRQVGAKRSQRHQQMEDAFMPYRVPTGARVLLVDDLTTTGATLEAAAKILRLAGAKIPDAAVFAQKQ